MKNRFSFKKLAAAFSAAALLFAAGIPGISSVTAWAAPSSGTIAEEGVNVRETCVDGEVLDTLSEGKEVSIVDSTTGADGLTWYQIVYTFEDMELGGWVRSDLVNVSDEEEGAGQEVEPSETETPETQDSEDAGSAASVNYVVVDSIPADMIPDGFQQTTVSYEGRDISALVMNSASVYLLYMEDESNIAPGRLVVYDMTKSELIPYISFETNDGFILLLNIPDAEIASVSDRFSLTVCEFEDGTMDALQMTQSDAVIAESANLAEYYYMYGVNRDGMYGWYVYNSAEGTIESNIMSMHYNLNGTTVEDEEEESGFSLDSLSLIVIIGILVVLLLLVVLVVVFGVRYRQLANEMDRVTMENAAKSKKKSTKKPGGQTSPAQNSRPPRPKTSGDTQSMDYFQPSGNSGPSESTMTDPFRGTENGPAPGPGPSQTQPGPDPDDDDLEFL